MLVIVAWGLLLESNVVTIVINGQQVTGPLKDAVGVGGLVVALIALFCAATLLVFVFAGIGVIVLGCFVIVGIIMATLAFPFLLPLLIPLAILWGFIAITRRTNTS
jgi:predicted exporter